LTHTAWLVLAALTMMISMTGVALAEVAPAAPEIDGGSLATGLGVLAAGVMIVRARRPRR